MGQRGFWDEQERVAKLQEKKPVLTRLTESIPWELFRPLLDKGYSQERKSNAGRKRIDPLILFKMLVLQQLFNLRGPRNLRYLPASDCHKKRPFGIVAANQKCASNVI